MSSEGRAVQGMEARTPLILEIFSFLSAAILKVTQSGLAEPNHRVFTRPLVYLIAHSLDFIDAIRYNLHPNPPGLALIRCPPSCFATGSAPVGALSTHTHTHGTRIRTITISPHLTSSLSSLGRLFQAAPIHSRSLDFNESGARGARGALWVYGSMGVIRCVVGCGLGRSRWAKRTPARADEVLMRVVEDCHCREVSVALRHLK
jgi:hypothetical protein